MRSPGPFSLLVLPAVVTLLAGACSDAEPDQATADPAVDDTAPDWDAEQTIQRTVLIEGALEDGFDRDAAGCMIDTTLAAGDFTLSDVEGIDFSAATGSGVDRDASVALADALIECGPDLRDRLDEDLPGALAIPETHAIEAECVTNAYVDAWRDAYADRFSDPVVADEEPVELEVTDRVVGIVAGCDAGGAVVLGASNAGNLDTFALNTLEWECLVSRLAPDAFIAALPFPEDPGDALDRMGPAVLDDVEYCEAWVSGGEVPEDPAEE